MYYGKKLFYYVVYMTDLNHNLITFKYPNNVLKNFLRKNYRIVIPMYQFKNEISFCSFCHFQIKILNIY